MERIGSRMQPDMKIAEDQRTPQNEKDFDGVAFLFVCLILVGVLAVVVKLCYVYSHKFPRKQAEEPAIERMNRRCISIKGAKGNRYSVA